MKLVRQIPLLVLFVLLGLLATPAQAHNALFAVTPHENQAGGLVFHITSEPLPDGGARFRVEIAGHQATLNEHPFGELGRLNSTKSARSIEKARTLKVSRHGETGVCVFKVSRAELADPDFCFFFSNFEHSVDERILFLLTNDFVFARLKDFAPRRP